MKGILARKIGMTRTICSETGEMVPVTVLEAPKATVLQVKTKAKDGYEAAVLGAFDKKRFGKNENKKFKFMQELKLEEGHALKKGTLIGLDSMEGVERVKISGVSRGRGFAGVIKRHGFQRGPESHGSHHHREPGSVGMCAKPARILKGKKMPGHLGAAKVTIQNVKVIQVDLDKNLIALKGAVPGAKNGFVFIREQ